MPNTTERQLKNSSPSAGQSPAITPLHEMPQDLLRRLSERGIDPGSIPDPDGGFVGIASAVGSSPEEQAQIDAWIASGGVPEFE